MANLNCEDNVLNIMTKCSLAHIYLGLVFVCSVPGGPFLALYADVARFSGPPLNVSAPASSVATKPASLQ